MDGNIQAGTTCHITHDIVINGVSCFQKGDRVVVEQLAEELADYPGAIYVIRSTTTGAQYRLRAADLTIAEQKTQPQPKTNTGRVTRAIVIDGVPVLGEGQYVDIINVSRDSAGAISNVLVRGNDGREYRVRPEAISMPQSQVDTTTPEPESGDCLHRFSKSSDGRVVCSKCGAYAPYKQPPPENFAPMVKCPKCGNPLGEVDLFCRKCREPNVPLIKKRAYDQNISSERCRHKFARFIDGRVCVTCGQVKYSGPTVVKRDGEGAVISVACSKCGAVVGEADEYCPSCSQRLKQTAGAERAPQTQSSELGNCPYCGAVNRGTTVFCEACGAQMLDSGKKAGRVKDKQPRVPSKPAAASSRLPQGSLLIVLGIILTTVAAFVFTVAVLSNSSAGVKLASVLLVVGLFAAIAMIGYTHIRREQYQILGVGILVASALAALVGIFAVVITSKGLATAYGVIGGIGLLLGHTGLLMLMDGEPKYFKYSQYIAIGFTWLMGIVIAALIIQANHVSTSISDINNLGGLGLVKGTVILVVLNIAATIICILLWRYSLE